jgi:hypothetical protein
MIMRHRTMGDGIPDFWSFLPQQETRLQEDFCRVTCEGELDAIRVKWLDPVVGILERIKNDPYFALAKPSAQKIFQEYIQDRVELESRYFREVWNL